MGKHLAKRSSLIYPIGTLVWAVIILILSTMPSQQLPQIKWLMTPDKFGHAFVYGVLAIGLYQSFSGAQKKAVYAGLWATGYGITMELVQYGFFPGRYFELWDIVANISGVFAALLIWKYIY
jgi:VanZ family protein